MAPVSLSDVSCHASLTRSLDGPVAELAGQTMVPMTLMVALMWFKSLEGSLVGIGDAAFMSLAFLPGALSCVVGTALAMDVHRAAGGDWGAVVGGSESRLQGVWMALLAYYLVVTVLLLWRWVGTWERRGMMRGEAESARVAE